MGRFQDKVAIVTGSSSGIGRATAVLFAREGAKVTITGRKADALKETKKECIAAGAKESDILDILGDITVETVQDILIKKTVEKFGALDILVNNHGGGRTEVGSDGSFLVETFDITINQNCKSVLELSTKAIPYLKKSKGNIVNVSSIASQWPVLNSPFYAVSKAALHHLTKIFAFKYAPDGIRVNSVSPGVIETQFLVNRGLCKSKADELFSQFNSVVPMKRNGQAHEIAEPIAFLADNKAASFVTGHDLVADGGIMLTHAVPTSNLEPKK